MPITSRLETDPRRAANRRRARWGRARRWGLGALALGAPFAQIPLDPARAQTLPQSGTVVGGAGTIQQTSSTQLTINQSSQNLSIDWQSFSIGAGHIVRFNQPNSSALALNRVIGPDPSQIFGQIQANGRVVIMNPAGIYFGPSSMVDVNGLVATTARMSQADFLAGTLNFSLASGDLNARVINEGAINVAQGGFAVLAAAAVENKGTVIAQGGTIVLAGTPTFTLDFFGDGLLKFAATGVVTQAPNGATALVENSGTLSANGGRVLMTARAARDVINNVINTTGIVEARSARLENGEIVIDGGDNGIVSVNGRVDVSGTAADATGGNVTVLGEKVGLFENARVDVSGAAGGGQVLVGGNYQGKGPEANAKMVYMDARAVIDASSSLADGGRVILWSDEVTRNAGHIDVSGANNGGFIEVSSKGHLDFRGTVNLRGASGRAGELLLDPNDITIGGADTNITNTTNTFGATGAGASIISLATLYAALGTGAVTVQTASGSGGSGNITVASAIAYTGAASSLTLLADRDILVNAAISSTNTLGLTLTAARSVSISSNITTAGGDIVVKANVSTWSNFASADPTFGATAGTASGVAIGAVTLNAGGGSIYIAGKGGTGTGLSGVAAVGPSSQLLTSGTGRIVIHGEGGLNGVQNHGVYLDRATVTASGTGGVKLRGTGGGGTSTDSDSVSIRGTTITIGGGLLDIFGNTPTAGNGVRIHGETIAGPTYLDSTLTATGTGAITIASSRNVFMGSSAGGLTSVTAASGDILITGNVVSWANPHTGGAPVFGTTSGNFDAVSIVAGVPITSTSGRIAIAGKGGTTGGRGFYLGDGVVLSAAGGAGSIALVGASLTGTAVDGYHSTPANAFVSGGTVSIVGDNGAGGDAGSYGIALNGAGISAAGNITVTGRGGAGGGNALAIVNGANLSSSGGSISLTGNSSNAGAVGVNVSAGSISAAGGAITIASNRDVTIGGTITTSGTTTINATGATTQTAAILGAGGLVLGGTGAVTLNHVGNNFVNVTLNRTGVASGVSLTTVASPNLQTSNIGTGNFSIFGLGFTQSGAITQGANGGTVAISGGAGTVTLNQANTWTGDLTVTGGSIAVSTQLQSFANTTAKTATFTQSGVGGTLSLAGIVATSGTLNIAGTAATQITVNGALTSLGGNITLYGNAPGGLPTAGTSAGDYIGVLINAGANVNAGGGNIAIAGRGGNTSADYGVWITGATVQTTGAGTLSITGLGDTNGTVDATGVAINTTSTVQTQNGALTITGAGGTGSAGGGGLNRGVYVNTSSIVRTTGSGALTLTGTGGGTGTIFANDTALYIGTATVSTGGSGLMTLVGNTPTGTGEGLVVVAGGSVSALGSGSISMASNRNVSLGGNVSSTSGDILITGNVASYDTTSPIFGSTTGDFIGVAITSGADITTTGGSIAIAGKGGTGGGLNPAGSNQFGVSIGASSIVSTALAGGVVMHGQGGPSANQNPGSGGSHTGIYLNGGATGTAVDIFTANGNIKLVGTGNSTAGGSGDNNGGVSLQYAKVRSTGLGSIDITGTAATIGTGRGVYIGQAGSEVTTATGNISITGTGGGAATTGYGFYNAGVEIGPAGIVRSTGSGNVTLTGLPGSTGSGILFSGASPVLGSGTMTGDMTLRTDALANTATGLSILHAAGSGTLTFRPNTDATTIGVNTGAGTLAISGALLGTVSGFSGIQVGSATQTGAIQINTTSFTRNLTVQTQGTAFTNGLTMGANNLTIIANGGYTQGVGAITSTGTVTFSGVGNVTATDAGNSFGSLVLAKTGSAANVTILTAGALSLGASTMGTGNLTLTGNGFTQTGGLVQDALGGAVSTVSINAGAGTATLGQANTITGNLTVAGGAVSILAAQSLAHAGLQTVSLTSTAGDVLVQGNITKTGTGGANVSIDAEVMANFNGAGVTTGGGTLTVWGNAPTGSSTLGTNAGTAWGVHLSGVGAVLNSGAGNINIVGKGSTDTTGQHGIVMLGGGSIQSTSGTITLQGRGGDGSGAGSQGIIIGTGSIQTQTGAISLTGWGGANSGGGHGITVDTTSSIVALAGANITLNGTGTNGGSGINTATAVTPTLNAGTGGLSLTSNNGLSLATTTLIAGGTTTLTGGAGAIVATRTNNQLTGTVNFTNSSGNVTLVNAAGYSFAFGASTAAGALSVTSGGALTQTGALTVGAAASFTAGAATLDLFTNGTANTFGGAVTLANSGSANVLINASGGLTLGAVSTGGNLTASALGGALTMNVANTFAAGRNVSLSSTGATTAGITITANQTLAGGAFVATSDRYFTISGATLNSGGGNITIDANTAGTNGGGDFSGVFVNNAIIESRGGNIALTGRGSASGTGPLQHGVHLYLGGIVRSYTGGADGTNGTITLTGTGGTYSGGGSGDNGGVTVVGPTSLVSSRDGNITINANGGTGASGGNSGLYVGGGAIRTDGTGSITATAAGGPGNASRAIAVTGNGGSFGRIETTGGGNITLTGTGGTSSGNNVGVFVFGGASNHGVIRATAATGNISITGTGGVGTGASNVGIAVQDANSVISTNGGTLTLNGTATSSGASSDGVYVALGGTLGSTTGAVSLTGSSASGVGISTSGSAWTIGGNFAATATGSAMTLGSAITLGSGATMTLSSTGATQAGITITGNQTLVGGALDVTSARTITVASGVTVNTGGGNITLYGNAPGGVPASGTGTGNYHGVMINTGANVNAGLNGNITIAGRGGSASTNYGVFVTGATVQTTGTGTLSITGLGGTGGTADLPGVAINAGSTVQTQNGALTVTGSGGAGTGGFNYGIYANNASLIRTTGNGALTMTGTGGSFANADSIYLGNSAISTAGTGALTLTGNTPGGTGAGVALATGGSISASGSAPIAISSALSVTLGGNITTAGGNISIWGNAPAGAPSGTPSVANSLGVSIYRGSATPVSVNANGGNISIAGAAGNGGNYNHGVLIDGVTVLTNGAGAISIQGKGGASAGGAQQVGVYINGDTYLNSPFSPGTAVTSGSGGVSINGSGGATGTGGYNFGVRIARATVTATGGSVSVVGTGGAGANSDSIEIAGGSVLSTGVGNITLQAASPVGTGTGVVLRDSYDLTSTAVVIGGGTHAGNTTLRTDSLTNTATSLNLSRSAGGSIYFETATNTTTIGVNGGAGGLQLTGGILGAVSGFNNLRIGSTTQTGTITTGAGWMLGRATYLTTNTGGAVSLGSIALASNELYLANGGATTQTGAITGAGQISLAGAGNVTLTNPSNSFTGLNTYLTGTPANVSVATTGVLNLGASSTLGLGTLSLTGAGITQAGSFIQDIGGGTVTLSSGTGNIALTNAANAFRGNVAFNTTGAGNVSLTNAVATALGASTVAGTLSVNSGSAMTQTGLLSVGLGATFTAGGAIALADPSNLFTGAVSLQNTGGNNATVNATGNLVFGTSSVGSLNVSVTGGTVSQVGAFTTTGEAAFTAPGGVTLTNPTNAFGGPLTLTVASGSAAVTNAGALQIGSFDVANDLTVTAGGAITQAGIITVGGTTSLSGGTMTLTSGSNNFGTRLNLAGTGGALDGTVGGFVGAAAATAVPAAIVPVSAGYTFGGTAVPAGGATAPAPVVTVTETTTIQQIAQVIAAILSSVASTTTSSTSTSGGGGGDAVGAAAVVSPVALQAALVAILGEAAASAGPGAGGAGTGPTGGPGDTATGGPGGGTTAGSGGEGGAVLVTPGSGPAPAAGTPAAPAPAGTFAVGTTITISTSGGATAVTVTPPVGGGPPQVILPGLLNLTPPRVPSATQTGTPGVSGNFMQGGRSF